MKKFLVLVIVFAISMSILTACNNTATNDVGNSSNTEESKESEVLVESNTPKPIPTPEPTPEPAPSPEAPTLCLFEDGYNYYKIECFAFPIYEGFTVTESTPPNYYLFTYNDATIKITVTPTDHDSYWTYSQWDFEPTFNVDNHTYILHYSDNYEGYFGEVHKKYGVTQNVMTYRMPVGVYCEFNYVYIVDGKEIRVNMVGLDEVYENYFRMTTNFRRIKLTRSDTTPKPTPEPTDNLSHDFPPTFTPIVGEGYSDHLGEYIDEYGRVLVVGVGTGEGVSYYINIYANQSDADNRAAPLLEASHGTMDYYNGSMVIAFEDSSGNRLYFERDNWIEDNYTLYVHGDPCVGGCNVESYLGTTFYMTAQYIDPMG